MAYAGYLIKLQTGSTWVEFPLSAIKVESYKVTPHQRMESEAARSVTGVLHRTTCAHTASKIEFETPSMTNVKWAELHSLLSNAYTSTLRRDITIEYYSPDDDDYHGANCYMPDIAFTILRADASTVLYDSIRLAFIEY